MRPRLGDRLDEARRRRFVGRAAEIELFESALSASDPGFNLIYVFGPGGIGKTSLLRQFALRAQQHGLTAIEIDGRNVEPSPDGFLLALARAMGLSQGQSPLEALASRAERQVLLVDTYELLNPLDAWLRENFLPQLPVDAVVVLAGRNPLALAWRTDPGWQSLVQVVPLRNLTGDESRDYLASRHVPDDQFRTVLDFTYGHPLALALVADAFVQRGAFTLRVETTSDIVRSLIERLVEKVPGPAHRAALEVCSLLRLTTEGTLAEILQTSDPSELFAWLRSLSFIESGPQGLFPHDLTRDALIADLRWRNPEWYAELHRRARAYYGKRVSETRGSEQQRVLFDYVYLHRDNPLMRPYLDWQETGTTLPDVVRPGDRDALHAMVLAHEGSESAQWLDYWLEHQPEAFVVYRDRHGQTTAFVAVLDLTDADSSARSEDPATRAAAELLDRRAPLRPGEKAIHFRFWMARDSYQDVSGLQSLIFGRAAQQYLTTPGLAFSFFPTAQPAFWEPMFSHVDLPRLPDADFTVGGHSYGVFSHDWRTTPPFAWLELLGEREIATEERSAPTSPATTAIVLSEPDFAEAVRAALRDLSRPVALRDNPLLRSRLVIERSGGKARPADRVSTLQQLLREAIDSLEQSPRDAKLRRALHHTYVDPAPTQEQAAEILDVPFSTYRRHLAGAVARVVDYLWKQEIGELSV
jgi:hypothetical protein